MVVLTGADLIAMGREASAEAWRKFRLHQEYDQRITVRFAPVLTLRELEDMMLAELEEEASRGRYARLP